MIQTICPEECTPVPCQVETDPSVLAERYADLLCDESRLCGDAIDRLYLPTSAGEVSWALRDIAARGIRCVVSAGRTGIAGGAVPIGCRAVISLALLNRPLAIGRDAAGCYIRAEPGLTLASLTGLLMKKEFGTERLAAATVEEQEQARVMMADPSLQLWFPVNPTEVSAHLGGIVATNASGSRSFRYGPTRQWVRGLTVVLADGRLLRLRRGETLARDGRFRLAGTAGEICDIPVTNIGWPKTKATLGYPLAEGMDLIDLFIGSEGTLGVIVEVELAIIERPPAVVGVLVMTPAEKQALALVARIRREDGLRCDAIEYFDRAALRLIREKREEEGGRSQLPDLPSWDGCGLYLELAGTEDEVDAGCERLEQVLGQEGLTLEDTWAATEPAELAAQRLFRHAVPETVNAIIGRRRVHCPGLHKVGTDMAVPDERLEELFALYRRDLNVAGIDSVIFGHIGNNHVHVNLLPKDLAELGQARDLYGRWADRVVAMGGAVAAEHGVGRMKKGLLARQFPAETLALMRLVRLAFDPEGRLSPGVLFD